MALTTTQVTQLTDSLSQYLTDFQTVFITNTGTGGTSSTTMTTGLSGTGTTAFLGRNLNLLDLTPEINLLSSSNAVVANATAYLTGIRSLTGIYAQFYAYMDRLDVTVLYNGASGLNAYLAGNGIQVNAYFAAAFNAYASIAVSGQFRTSATAPTPLASANYFPFAAIDSMWSFTSSGATTFSSNAVGANATTAVSGGGIAQFYIYKSNSGSAVGGGTITVTYTNAAGSPATATVSTTSLAQATLSTGTAISGAIGSAITAVTGTGMTSGEAYTIGTKLVRTPTY